MIRSFIGPLVMTFCLAMIVLILQFVWRYIDELVGKGLTWSVVFELISYASASLIPLAIILGVLLASLMTFGNLGEHSELSALKSSGISLTRIMTPLIALVAVITLGAFAFSNYVIPKTNQRFFTLLMDIRQQRPEFDIKASQFYNGLEGYSLKIGRKAKDSRMLYDLMIYDHTKKMGNISVTVADSGHMVITEDKRNLMLTLYGGYNYAEQLDNTQRLKKTRPFRRDKFGMQQFLFTLPSNELDRTEQDVLKDHFRRKNMHELSNYVSAFRITMNKKREKVTHDLLQVHYFRFADKKDTLTPLSDHQQKLATLRIDLDQVYDSLPLAKRENVLKEALSQARVVSTMIKNSIDLRKGDETWISKYEIEWHRKLTQSLACLIFCLIGASLGAIIRKGGLGTPVVVSTLFFIFYYIISLAGEKYAKTGVTPVWVGMWGPTLVLLAIGVYLTIKSTRDSVILSTDTYTLLIKKILRFGKRNPIAENEDSSSHQ